MRIAKEQFNPYVQVVEEAQESVREIIKFAFLNQLKQSVVNHKLESVIQKSVENISIPTLKSDISKSLWNFANKQRILWQSLNMSPNVVSFLGKEVAKERPLMPPSNIHIELNSVLPPSYVTSAVGVPLQRYYQDIWKERVKPTIDRLAREQALDPNDYTGRNSLRNLAEMEVRYHDHQDSITSLKDSGVRLVVCSAHADCSKRCAQWQGRIYSLDGTSGVVDGHRYVPLEAATDIWYTTKAGRRYKNGLLGFNCRHHITEYKGYVLPTVSAEERKKQYAVTMRQRELERAVRNAKATAVEYKGINTQKYKSYIKQAKDLYSKYIKFCSDNNRAYYPMRVSI